jgi:hypothetical protein
MYLPDVVEIYEAAQARDDQGRVVEEPALLGTEPARVAPMSTTARQREYGQEVQATHDGWHPANSRLTLDRRVLVRIARSDPAIAGRVFTVKTLMNVEGRFIRTTLVPAPPA